MMKKSLPLWAAFVLLSASSLTAQVFYSDDFSNSSLPGWTIVNNNPNSAVVWHWSNSPSSSGSAAGTFQYAGAGNGYIIADSDAGGDQNGVITENTTITSRAIDCSGKSTIILTFYELFAKFQSDTPEVLISTDSTNWTVVHNSAIGLPTNTTTPNPNYVVKDISSIAGNQPTVYIRFSWKGTFDYWWFVDEVTLFVPDSHNAASVSVINRMSNGCSLTNAEPIGIKFQNKGLQPISTLTANYSVNGGAVVSETVNLGTPLNYDSTYSYHFTQTADFSAPNSYLIRAWVDLANDTVPVNDSTTGFAISVAPANLSTPYTMGFEVPNFGTEVNAFAWTTEDANNDGYTWGLSTASPNTGGVNFRYLWNDDGTTAANDWLFSPCLTMSASKAYKISFFDEVGEDSGGLYEEKIELKAGISPSSSNMTETVFDFGIQSNSGYEERKAAFKPSAGGTYHIGFHCYSDADSWFLNIDDVSISELDPPTATFSTALNGTSVSVIDGSDELIDSWTWNWGDGNTATGKDPGTHTYAQPGTYIICLKVTNLSGADSVCHSIIISGINDIDASANVSVYPNPTHNVVNVFMSDELKNHSTLEIVNALGETVAKRASSGQSIEKFEMDKFAPGVYCICITAEGVKAMKKFVYTR